LAIDALLTHVTDPGYVKFSVLDVAFGVPVNARSLPVRLQVVLVLLLLEVAGFGAILKQLTQVKAMKTGSRIVDIFFILK
jgi:hypothetical protein